MRRRLGLGGVALSISLLRAVGDQGGLSSYERRQEFAEVAQKNVTQFFGGPEGQTHPAWELRLGDLAEELARHVLLLERRARRDDHLAAVVHHEVAQQAAEGRDLDVLVGRRDLGRDLQALGDGEHRALVVAGGHGQDEAVEQARGAPHQVFVPERHRVEGAGVDGGERGGGGGALLVAPRFLRGSGAVGIDGGVAPLLHAPSAGGGQRGGDQGGGGVGVDQGLYLG